MFNSPINNKPSDGSGATIDFDTNVSNVKMDGVASLGTTDKAVRSNHVHPSDTSKQAALTFGIANTNAVKIDDADAENGDYAKMTASGLQGRSTTEVKQDLDLEVGTDVAAQTHASQHGVSGTDTVFPADPGADRYLMWDDVPGALIWAEGTGSGGGDVATDTIWDAAGDLAVGTGSNTASKVNIGAEEVVARIGAGNIDGISMAAQTVLGRLTGGSIAAVAIGIGDNNIVQIDGADVANAEYARFTANGLESRTKSEVAADIKDQFPQAITDNHVVTVDSADAADDEYARFTAGGLEGRSKSEVAADLKDQFPQAITDNHVLTVDQADAATGEYAKFTANGLESKSSSEMKTDLSFVTSTTITALVALTQAQYEALSPAVSTTLYATTDTQHLYLGTIQLS